MNNKNDKSISRSRLTGKYLTRNDILKMSAIKAKNNILEEELAHYGILGMKWGVRRTKEQLGYRSTNISSALARRANKKVDAGFKKLGGKRKEKGQGHISW